MIGLAFNRLTILKESDYKDNRQKNWICRCVCGNQTIVPGPKLKSGHTQSCGCLKLERSKQNTALGIKWIKSEEGRRFVSNRNSSRRGPLAFNWKGGKEEENIRLRRSPEAMKWRQQVFERDGFLCQLCKQNGKRLNAHHDKPWSLFPEARYELSNGITVCKDCHKNIHKVNGNPKRKKCLH